MQIEGMKCMHCKASVENALKSIPGVRDAEADPAAKTARIILETDVKDEILMTAVREKGFEPVKMI